MRYFEYSIGSNDITDAEYPTAHAALEAAEETYGDTVVENMSPRNGELFTEDLIIYEYRVDDLVNDGNPVEIDNFVTEVEYEHYHGDLKEHGYP